MLMLLAVAGLAFAGCKGSQGAAGAAGTSCTTHDNGNGTVTISCADGTSATVSNGAAGADGAPCTLVGNTITCGTSSITVSGAVVDYTLLSVAERADALPSIVITNVSFPDDGRPVVTFKVSDRKGNGLAGFTRPDPLSTATPPGNTNAGNFRFGLLKLTDGVNGSANSTWVSYLAANGTSTAGSETASTTSLTEGGDGTYSYRFTRVINGAGGATAGTTYDASAPHRLAMIMSASGNPYQPVNVVQDFIPATGELKDGAYDKVDGAACLECHKRFRAPAGGTAHFHGGARYDVRVCVTCHNDQRRFTTLSATTVGDAAIQADGTWTGNLAIVNGEGFINLPVFIHKIHMGEDLTLRGGTYAGMDMPYEVTFPQDVRNCAKCHRNVALADNWKNRPSRRACGACHDNRAFTNGLVIPGTSGYVRELHSGGEMTDDSSCALCHTATGADSTMDVVTRHRAVAAPDPNSIYSGGTNGNTNAAFLAAAGSVPPGASVITYDVSSVSRDASKHPVIVFKFKRDGADVVFNTYAAGAELIAGFVGSPSVYFAWATPEDGIAAPADYNAIASGYVKTLWSTGGAGFTGPDASGYYTATLTATTVPDNAVMLTGAVGYSYSLSSTQPLTQVDLGDYPYNATTKVGGLIVPAPDVWKVGTGYTPRRTVVETARCNKCHAFLGANPTFHAGQRNDAPTCSFCHTPNRMGSNSGWSANVKDFIHGIHGAAKRTVPFTWHATSATSGFYQVTYPGILNSCDQCHVPQAGGNTYDFSATASAAALPSMLFSTVATGTFDSRSAGNPTGYYTVSPYVVSDRSVDYGYGYATSDVRYTLPDGLSGTQGATTCTPAAPCVCTTTNPCSVTVGANYAVYNQATSVSVKQGSTTCTDAVPCTCTTASTCSVTVATCTTSAPCQAQPTTLVKSPIAAACSACHDSAMAIDHMLANGGSFYQPRSMALAKPEQCMLCHAKGKIAAIEDVHR